MFLTVVKTMLRLTEEVVLDTQKCVIIQLMIDGETKKLQQEATH